MSNRRLLRPARHLRAVPSPEDVTFVMPPVPLRSALPDNPSPQQTAQALLREVDADNDPLEAEFLASMLLASLETMPDPAEMVGVHHFLPVFEHIGSPAAVGMLAAFAELADGPISKAAVAARDRLLQRGVRFPSWALPLIVTPTVCSCRVLGIPGAQDWLLAATFDRPRSSHGIVVMLDPHQPRPIAADIVVMDSDELAGTIADAAVQARFDDFRFTETPLDPADFRRRVQAALDTRADSDHDADDPINLVVDDTDTTQLSYHSLVPFLRARMRCLPRPVEHEPSSIGTDARVVPLRRTTQPGPAHTTSAILVLRIDVAPSRPPTWRRVEVPADCTLHRLHRIIQIAFGWSDSHPHLFHTPHGRFGDPADNDRISSEFDVTLEQLIVEPLSRFGIRYVYELPARYEVRIVVQRLTAAKPDTHYPRCTTGRRVPPPESTRGENRHEGLMATIEFMKTTPPNDFPQDAINEALRAE